MWRQLSSKYVVPLLGIYNEDIPSGLDSMVSEWMHNGNLKTFLDKSENRKVNRLHLVCIRSLLIPHELSNGICLVVPNLFRIGLSSHPFSTHCA